jgi:putative transposase
VTLRLIQAGKPTQNAYVESFNGKFRDECLNEHWLRSLAEAREIIGAWRAHYNQRRPHSALGYQSPREVRCRLACPACLAGSKRIGYTHQQEFYELILGSK